MNYLYGAAFATVLILCFEGVRGYFWNKKMDRRFQQELKVKDWVRAEALREAGADEEGIAELQTAIEEARANPVAYLDHWLSSEEADENACIQKTV